MTEYDLAADIRDADMVLVGLGEEFDCSRTFREDAGYREGRTRLEHSEKAWLLPTWMRLYREQHPDAVQACRTALTKLEDLLREKNYYAISVSVNRDIAGIPWRAGRLVSPCGSDTHVQYGIPTDGEERIRLLQDEEQRSLEEQLATFRAQLFDGKDASLPEGLSVCPHCGVRPELCNIFHPKYDESLYLDDWSHYTRWLQGSLNRKLLILELGVGLQYPSVIRFPFERIACLNQKSRFYRVHETLYQLTPELTAKGVSIPENAIDCLTKLC